MEFDTEDQVVYIIFSFCSRYVAFVELIQLDDVKKIGTKFGTDKQTNKQTDIQGKK